MHTEKLEYYLTQSIITLPDNDPQIEAHLRIPDFKQKYETACNALLETLKSRGLEKTPLYNQTCARLKHINSYL